MFTRLLEEAQADGDAGGGEEGNEAVEQKARQLGWVPQDEWKGDGAKWKPAGEFLERGEDIMPILKANNRRLHQQLSAQQQETAALRQQMTETNEILNALKESNAEIAKERKQNQITVLTTQIAEAREADDVALESRLQARLTNLTRELEEDDDEDEDDNKARRRTKTDPAPQDFRQTQWWQDWQEENDWYGQDEAKTYLADAVAPRLRANPANANLKEKAFMDKVTAEVARLTGGAVKGNGRAKVEGGGNRGSGGGGGDEAGYSDLPADAKVQCDRQAKRLVGTKPGQFKTEKEYRSYYVRTYFGK